MTAHLASQIGTAAKAIVRGFREQIVHKVSTSHRDPFPARHYVLVVTILFHRTEAVYFYCNDQELASLNAGYSPEEIGLEAVETEDEDAI